MGLRSLPFFKAKKGFQFAGGGFDSSGGGESYTLPPATASTLGGIIAGDGLNIDATGNLSVKDFTLLNSVTADGVKNYRTLISELFTGVTLDSTKDYLFMYSGEKYFTNKIRSETVMDCFSAYLENYNIVMEYFRLSSNSNDVHIIVGSTDVSDSVVSEGNVFSLYVK